MTVTKDEIIGCKVRFEHEALMRAYDRLLYLEWYEAVGGGFAEDERYLEDELKICKAQVEYYGKDLYWWTLDREFYIDQMYRRWKKDWS